MVDHESNDFCSDETNDFCGDVNHLSYEVECNISVDNEKNNVNPVISSVSPRETDNRSTSEYIKYKLETFIGLFRKDQKSKRLNIYDYEYKNVYKDFDMKSDNKPVTLEIEKLCLEKSNEELEKLKERVSLLEIENLRLKIDKLDLINDIKDIITNNQNESSDKVKRRVDSIHI
jgi:hypothetical protein